MLQQMENLLKDKEAEKTWHMQEADAAHKRNTVLLNDIETARKKLHSREHLLLHPDTVKLETLYWAKVDEAVPKWEAFFLGKAQTPIGIKTIKPAKRGTSPTKRSI